MNDKEYIIKLNKERDDLIKIETSLSNANSLLEIDVFNLETKVAALEAKLLGINNLSSESKLHRHECECLVCQVHELSKPEKGISWSQINEAL